MTMLVDLFRRRLVVAVVVALAAALVCWQGKALLDHRRADDRRDAALDVAESVVLDLTTMSASTVHARIKAIQSNLADGDFKSQLSGFATAFASEVSKQKITSTGKIAAAAVGSVNARSASVLVASSADVRQSGATSTVPATKRYWRFKVVLARQSDRWLVSKMEFVQ